VDLYLCGTKGLAALQAALQYPQDISSVQIMSDSGLSNDPYSQMVKLVKENGLNLVTGEILAPNAEALAVGWKFLITNHYQRLFVIHDSLLPKYRGWNPLVTALQNRDTEIGATLILADEQIDHGPIILQKEIRVTYPLKIVDAMNAVEDAIRELVEFLFKQPDRCNLSVLEQDESLASYSIWRNEQDYRIEWSGSAEDILSFINSVSFPYKGALTSLDGNDLRIFDARVVPDLFIVNRTPGKVWKLENQNPIIVCGDGLIQILDFSLEDLSEGATIFSSVKSRLI
jgi:methionyl-tRNA formyltransferase